MMGVQKSTPSYNLSESHISSREGGYAESTQLQSQTYHSVNTEMEPSSYLNSIPLSVRSSVTGPFAQTWPRSGVCLIAPVPAAQRSGLWAL
jgi:hypothetical protein